MLRPGLQTTRSTGIAAEKCPGMTIEIPLGRNRVIYSFIMFLTGTSFCTPSFAIEIQASSVSGLGKLRLGLPGPLVFLCGRRPSFSPRRSQFDQWRCSSWQRDFWESAYGPSPAGSSFGGDIRNGTFNSFRRPTAICVIYEMRFLGTQGGSSPI